VTKITAKEMPAPECEGGYPSWQVGDMLAERKISAVEFQCWMRGQTMMLCQGQRYNYETEKFEEACGGVAHGGVVYVWDMLRFLNGQPIID
jgi:hypothetical protein